MSECEHHARTVAAARAGEPDAHASTCARCRDTRAVAGALDVLARGVSRLPPPALDARALFHRSRFLARLLGEQRSAERSARPRAFARVVAMAVLAGAIGWTLLGSVSMGPLGADAGTALGLTQALTRLAAWPLAVGALAALATARFLWVED
jgi:hypothetical protein